MKAFRVIRRALWAILLLSLGTFARNAQSPPQSPQSPQSPASRQEPVQSEPQSPNSDQLKTFAGKIARSNGKYILKDLSSTVSYSLDDQKAARKYAGKVVLVTGVFDSGSNTIHVKKIEIAS